MDLSLVAGAPQSFIQQLSQPRYSRRPVVQPPQGALLTPQTHDPTLITGVGRLRGSVRDQSSGALPGASVRVLDPQLRTVAQTTTNATGSYAIDGLAPGTYRVEVALAGFQTVTSEVSIGSTGESVHDAVMRVGSVAETLTVTGEAPAAAGSGLGAVRGGSAGGVAGGFAQAPPRPDQAAIARSLADLQVAAASRELTDLFEYRLTNSISVRRNQSALVPIINVPASIERVSLWNGRVGIQPLRALWLTNSSDLTLDAGTFSVVDGGAFAGEGLIEPLKPQEKRLLSYAVDLGLQIDARQGDERRMISRITLQRGVVIEQREQRSRRVYTIRNNDTTDSIRRGRASGPARMDSRLGDSRRDIQRGVPLQSCCASETDDDAGCRREAAAREQARSDIDDRRSSGGPRERQWERDTAAGVHADSGEEGGHRRAVGPPGGSPGRNRTNLTG